MDLSGNIIEEDEECKEDKDDEEEDEDYNENPKLFYFLHNT